MVTSELESHEFRQYAFETLQDAIAFIKTDELWNKQRGENGKVSLNEVKVTYDKDLLRPFVKYRTGCHQRITNQFCL